ncbi:MAG: hypothetical protein ACRD3L_18140 [Terriglobales bacterium]
MNNTPVASPQVDPGPASTAADSVLNEDSILAALKSPDLQPDLIEKISKSSVAAKSRKVKLAIVRHAKSPRHVSLSLIRKLYTFDLMQVALTPAAAGDLKMSAEEVLINRLESLSAGEKLSLAHRASGRVAGELLLVPEPRIVEAALENPRLTEVLVTRAVLRDEASPGLIRAICAHSKWSLRREIRIALLRIEHTPLEFAVAFAKSFPNSEMREILRTSQLPEGVKASLAPSSEL